MWVFPQTVDVPDDEQICVEVGDVIGVQYANKNLLGVVPYEQSGRASSVGLAEDQMSRIVGLDRGNVPVGTTVTVRVSGVKRLIALKPVIGI